MDRKSGVAALRLAAVRNNALWCDTVCRARGITGRFLERLWVSERATPPYYPNIVTLQPSSSELRTELDAAVARVRAAIGDRLSIKDSFADVDLAPYGMRVLFEAEWIARAATLPAPEASGDVAWSMVRDEAGLDPWKAAWDAEILKVDPVLDVSLLNNNDVAFMAAHRDGEVVGGAIASKGAGVVGISNVFACASDGRNVRTACLRQAMAWAHGLPVVGYETGAEFEDALADGFEPIGHLRVWVSGG